VSPAPVDTVSRAQRLTLLCLALLCATGVALCFVRLTGQPVRVRLGGSEYVCAAAQWFALLAALPLTAAGSWFGVGERRRALRILGWFVRSALLATLALGLSRPARLVQSRRVSVVLAADVSDSIDPPARARSRDFMQRALQAHPEVTTTLVAFARDSWRLRTLSELDARPGGDAAYQMTDLAAALQFAYGARSEASALRVVLLSDGHQNVGDAATEALHAAQLGVEIDHVQLKSELPPELGVRRCELPAVIEVGRPFRVGGRFFATQASDGEVELVQVGSEVRLAHRHLNLSRGETQLELPLVVHLPGPIEYRLELTPTSPDHFAGNNVASCSGFARGNSRILMIDSQPERLEPVARALREHEFLVEARAPAGLPRTAEELAQFDFVILSDVPADRLPAGSGESLERYVRDQGGGLLMAGGDASFGPGGYEHTRLASLLPVSLAGEARQEEPSLALALLIDCSGSMAGSKIELAKQAARAAVEVLSPRDLIEVIGFAGEPSRLLRLQSASNRMGIGQNIARLSAQGGTQLFPALEMAYQDLTVVRARRKHVIVLTDGQTQEFGIPELVQSMSTEAITVSTVGLGRDVQRDLLQLAANMGGGRAYFTDDPANVPRIFVDETTTHKRTSVVERPTRMQLREPADFLKGIDLANLPALSGYMVTQPKPKPAQVILESDTAEPLLARVRVGLGYVLAFTPDLKGRWSAELLRWPGFDRFISQLVREHLRKAEADELPMTVAVRAGVAHISVDAYDPEHGFIHGLDSRVNLVGAAASAVDRPLTEAAPGRYEAELTLPGYGSFRLRATHRLGGRAFGHSHADAPNPYPPEYEVEGADPSLLARMSALTGGRALENVDSVFRPARRSVAAPEELWPIAIWLGLALFVLDLVLRRIRFSSR
jgi:Ca-activated chloride channel family protein